MSSERKGGTGTSNAFSPYLSCAARALAVVPWPVAFMYVPNDSYEEAREKENDGQVCGLHVGEPVDFICGNGELHMRKWWASLWLSCLCQTMCAGNSTRKRKMVGRPQAFMWGLPVASMYENGE